MRWRRAHTRQPTKRFKLGGPQNISNNVRKHTHMDKKPKDRRAKRCYDKRCNDRIGQNCIKIRPKMRRTAFAVVSSSAPVTFCLGVKVIHLRFEFTREGVTGLPRSSTRHTRHAATDCSSKDSLVGCLPGWAVRLPLRLLSLFNHELTHNCYHMSIETDKREGSPHG